MILALNLLFYRTALGRAFRATSDDLEVAQLMGIDHRRIFAIAMGIALIVVTRSPRSISACAPISIRPSGRRG